MKTVLLALLAASVTVPAQGGTPSRCTNAPVTITFLTDYNAGISSDAGTSLNGSDVYANGGGVQAILNCNGESIELSGTRPTYLNLNFSQPLNNGTAPGWASSTTMVMPIAFFNIPLGNYFNNAQPSTQQGSFTTYLKATLANSAGFFYMEHPMATAPLNPPDSGVNNSICTTSFVDVDHYPAGTYNNDATAPETWDIQPDLNPQPPLCTGATTNYNVGTLVYPLGKGNKTGTAQYSAPFHILVQRQ